MIRHLLVLGVLGVLGSCEAGDGATWARFAGDEGDDTEQPSLGPFVLEDVAAWAYGQAVSTPLRDPTGLGMEDVLDLGGEVVGYFRQWQDEAGAIIDPIEGIEIQYATPTYALTCATLVHYNHTATQRPNLLQSCISALNSSILAVAHATAPQGHNNFFIKPVMLTLQLLRPNVSHAVNAYWNATLKELDPFVSYHGFLSNNWGIVAVAGEYLRVSEGLCVKNCSWWEQELEVQLAEGSFTGNGMYQDHTGTAGLNPLPYDEFPRGYIASMLRFGYSPQAKFGLLEQEVVARGAELSMLMQTPRGDIPTGGRSQMHQWNEGTAFELYSLRARDMVLAGNLSKACMFRRAANLALSSLIRWRTTPQEAGINGSGILLFPTMCSSPLQDRCGWMSYTYTSQYNLLPLAKLSASLLLAPEAFSVQECATYTDAGGFAFHLPHFQKVIANAKGTYVHIETGADPHYDSTGIQRVQSVRRSKKGGGRVEEQVLATTNTKKLRGNQQDNIVAGAATPSSTPPSSTTSTTTSTSTTSSSSSSSTSTTSSSPPPPPPPPSPPPPLPLPKFDYSRLPEEGGAVAPSQPRPNSLPRRASSYPDVGAPQLLGPLSGSWWEHGALNLGPVWELDPACVGVGAGDAVVDSLANQTYADVSAVQFESNEADVGQVSFTVTFTMLDSGIQVVEKVVVAEGGMLNVSVAATHPANCASKPFKSFGVQIPVLITDGKRNISMHIDTEQNTVQWSHPDLGATTVSVPQPSITDPVTWKQAKNPTISPNGLLLAVNATVTPTTATPSMEFSLETWAP